MKLKFKTETFNVLSCPGFLAKVRGLMFKFPINLIFSYKKDTHVDLHMIFVFFPIDIVFLDSKFKVLKVVKKAKPFTPFIGGCKCRYVLEVRDCKGLTVGDKLYKLVD